MSDIQFIYGEGGEKIFAIVPIDRYASMSEAEEMMADITAFDEARTRIAAGEELIPGVIVDRILDGENPLRVWRHHRGLTQDELAVRAGVQRSYISAIERGRQAGSLRVLRHIAAALEVDLDDLVAANE